MKHSHLRPAFHIVLCLLISLAFAADARCAGPDYSKTPVFLVHGYNWHGGCFYTLVNFLKDSGYPPEFLRTINLVPGDGANIPAAENQIAPAIETFLTSVNNYLGSIGQPVPPKDKVDIVSHSMGGLSSRWYTAKVRPDRVRKWIPMAGANHGTNALCGYSGQGADDCCPAYATTEQESLIQISLNGQPHVADIDETPYGIGTDSPGVNILPPDQNRRIFYVTIRTFPDSWIKPEDSVIIDGAGGLGIPIPLDLQAKLTSEGNILMTNGVGHDPMLQDGDTLRLVKIILGLLEGDFDQDGDVDGSDLAVFAADFGRTDCDQGELCEGDFDKDRDVDGSDLAIFAVSFGRTS